MWIKARKDMAIDLSKAIRIYCTPFNGQHMIEAELFDSTVTVKIFENVDDAQKFIGSLVDELNGNKPKLGYAFTWLARVEQLPPDDRAKFDKQVNEWLAELQGSLQPTDTKGEFVLNPKKFNDDGVEW